MIGTGEKFEQEETERTELTRRLTQELTTAFSEPAAALLPPLSPVLPSQFSKSFPWLNAIAVIPTGDGRLETTFDPKELAIDCRSLIAHQAEHEVRRLLWIVTAGLFHPTDPVTIGFSFSAQLFGFS